MVPGKAPRHDLRAKTTYRIQTRAREISTAQVGDEESKTNANRGKECGFRFLDSKHQYCYDEERGQEHFDKESLGDGGAMREFGVNSHRARKHCGDEGGGDHSTS